MIQTGYHSWLTKTELSWLFTHMCPNRSCAHRRSRTHTVNYFSSIRSLPFYISVFGFCYIYVRFLAIICDMLVCTCQALSSLWAPTVEWTKSHKTYKRYAPLRTALRMIGECFIGISGRLFVRTIVPFVLFAWVFVIYVVVELSVRMWCSNYWPVWIQT